MDPQKELKILKLLKSLVLDEEQVIRRQTRKRAVISWVGWLGLVVAFYLALLKAEHAGMVASVIAALAGFCGGIAIFAKDAARQWPAIRPHFDQKSIEERIRRLETEP